MCPKDTFEQFVSKALPSSESETESRDTERAWPWLSRAPPARTGLPRPSSDSESRDQGLTLVHFSAQREPFLTLNTSPKRLKHPLNTPCPIKSAYVELTGGRV
jgi:hypothetical protein